jgi:hypothetical protein
VVSGYLTICSSRNRSERGSNRTCKTQSADGGKRLKSVKRGTLEIILDRMERTVGV